MPPRSPLPRRHALDASWLRTPDRTPGVDPPWRSVRDFLRHRLPARVDVDTMLAEGAFVDQQGRPFRPDAPYAPNMFVWFHRELPAETAVPFDVRVLHRDDRVVVADKPPFLASMPRGSHVRETVVVRLREALDLPDLVPAHRLDRLTSGVLLLVADPRHRAAYASMFAAGGATKTYEAVAGHRPDLALPRTESHRIEKHRGKLQAEVVDGEPNAETHIEVLAVRGRHALYRLTPRTGRTHQLRVQLAALGMPIVGDPLYPRVLDVPADDFSLRLQLVARRLRFVDPVDQTPRDYVSGWGLTWPDGVPVGE